MKVTIYDVAKKAGVSIATVSKVINNKGNISEKTRKKVLDVKKKLDFHPNVMASALTGKKTKTIGLLIPDLANPFFSDLARNIEDSANELGYNLIMCSTDYLAEKENKYLSLLKQKNVDGFILASGFEDLRKIQELMEENIPVSIIARDSPMIPINTVVIDDFMGGYQATSYLISLGHENIGIIARNIWSNRERLRGYKQALEDNGIKAPGHIEYAEEISIGWGKKITQNYLNSDNPPTAVFTCNDLLGIGAIHAAREYGISVPEQLSVIGFDDTMIATIIAPSLTTMAQPVQIMGKEIMELMVGMIERNEIIKQIILMPELVVRESTAKVIKKYF
ncbi:LacI family DNA-binding transcriptional regulator [Neobacillus mesonae]|uniref:LacI family DNA-binding transcriptional regulator n=1 Tax=Neobacillus mesonae TaxID=1193713 RepID=UPI00203AFAAB|nr:LacI family DNA-binding transcriptional regulator [Neobacillus mesonae]MCM3569870.1 LacI family transcriptional regulator [Neobacillus mesonae]